MDTELPNYHIVSEGFIRLRKPLVDYEVSVFKDQYGRNWWDLAVMKVLKGDYRDKLAQFETDSERIDHLDVARALILMFANWDRVFKYRTSKAYPGLAENSAHICSKLLELRNESAHVPMTDFSRFRTETGIKQMAVLCRCFDETQAERISELLGLISRPAPERKASESAPDPASSTVKRQDVTRGAEESYNFIKDDRTTPMRIGDVIDACIKSTIDQGIFDRIPMDGRRSSESVVPIESIEFRELDMLCTIYGTLVDNQEYELYLGRTRLPAEEIEYTYYDRDAHIIGIHVTPKILGIVRSTENPDLKLVSDLSFLVRNVHDFLLDHKGLIQYPQYADSFPPGSYGYPSNPAPTGSQKKAVDTILNSRMSYVWGAPGTGKTQMTLATAILACLKKGQRVAIIAPTNLSVEQVLRGVLGVIEKDPAWHELVDPGRDILRLGTASEEFLRQYPEVCEGRSMGTLINRKASQLEKIKEIPFQRDLPVIEGILEDLRLTIESRNRTADRKEHAELSETVTRLSRSVIARFDECNKRVEAGISGNLTSLEDVQAALAYVRSHPTTDSKMAEFLEWTPESLQKMIDKLNYELDMLCIQSTKADSMDAKIIACTPHTYIARFTPRGTPGPKAFRADHIFIDEAGYCSAVLALTLLANGVPVTLLGDHKQLPPVCPTDQERIDKAKEQFPEYFKDPEFMKYWYLWDLPSIYLDTLFVRDLDEIREIHDEHRLPVCREMKCCSLTESYRFGTNLAKILDEEVYHNGITGDDRNNLDICCIDVKAPLVPVEGNKNGEKRALRVNVNEAAAIRDYLEENPMNTEDFCILTPYLDQIGTLNSLMPELAHKNIITVHRSQGREWDTVFLSVQDGLHMMTLDEPLRFTSSRDKGLNLINTAVSRAKSRLIIVCDREYWMKLDGELIGRLVKDAKVIRPKAHEDLPEPNNSTDPSK